MSIASVYDDNLFAEVEGNAGKMLQLRPSFEGNYESPRLTLLSLYSQDMLRSNFSTLNTLDARRHAFFDTKFLSYAADDVRARSALRPIGDARAKSISIPASSGRGGRRSAGRSRRTWFAASARARSSPPATT